jgi:formate hydrogenlyase subunit 3/multisubunit Na+/H+ antiporter MnhD subunit
MFDLVQLVVLMSSILVIYLVLPSYQFGLPLVSYSLTGMLFKSGSGTFPFWAPDVYEGSPALTTALMSTLAR